jgi:hypothetical protein
MDRERTFTVKFIHAINGLAHHIHDPAADLGSNGHGYRRACTLHRHASVKAIGAVHGYCTHSFLTYMLLNFNDKDPAVLAEYLKGFMDRRKLAGTGQFEMDINHRADDLRYITF